jgi:hypothetical protein
MSVIYIETEESPAPPLAVCPKCGRQIIRIDGYCDCEMLFFVAYRRR